MSAASWLQAIPVSEKWRALFFTRGPRVATWALALALGIQAAMILTDLAGADRAPSPAVIAAASRVQRAPVDIAAITNTHLFGVAPTAAGAGDANAPQTNMPLVLTGVIAANDPRDGLAILGPNVTTTKVYAVGDNIPGGARLHAVLSDHVLLERDGRVEALALPHQLAGGNAPPPSISAAPIQPALERMRELVSRNPGIIGDIMRPEPVFAGGKQQGFRVYPGRDPEVFLQLGLRPGDLVTAIDGQPLNDAQGEEILRTLGSSSEAHVTVLRNGQQQDLTLDLAAVEQEAESLAGSQNGMSAPPPPPPQRSLPFAPPQRAP